MSAKLGASLPQWSTAIVNNHHGIGTARLLAEMRSGEAGGTDRGQPPTAIGQVDDLTRSGSLTATAANCSPSGSGISVTLTLSALFQHAENNALGGRELTRCPCRVTG